jgi:hypothetical protein
MKPKLTNIQSNFIEHHPDRQIVTKQRELGLPGGRARERETWHRATTSKRCARMSTSFPLPSSPHCVPSTAATWLSDSRRPLAAADDGSSAVAGTTGAALSGRNRRGAGPGRARPPPQPAAGRRRGMGAGSSERGASGMSGFGGVGAGGGRRQKGVRGGGGGGCWVAGRWASCTALAGGMIFQNHFVTLEWIIMEFDSVNNWHAQIDHVLKPYSMHSFSFYLVE